MGGMMLGVITSGESFLNHFRWTTSKKICDKENQFVHFSMRVKVHSSCLFSWPGVVGVATEGPRHADVGGVSVSGGSRASGAHEERITPRCEEEAGVWEAHISQFHPH